MALAYALQLIEEGDCAADQLRRVPGADFRRPREAEIVENTLLELRSRRRALALQLRLQRRQGRLEPEWRAPLREALDWLRDCRSFPC